jgi:type IV pilus assembly protein PilC
MKRPAWLRDVVVITVVTAVAGICLTQLVLPKFRQFVASLHAQLPLPTRILLAVAGFVASGWLFFFGAAVGAVLAIGITSRNKRS